MMWDRLFSVEAIAFMRKLDEEDESILQFFSELKTKKYSDIQKIVLNWHTYEEDQQVGYAIYHVGEFHASRFLMFVDYLSMKYQRGEMVL